MLNLEVADIGAIFIVGVAIFALFSHLYKAKKNKSNIKTKPPIERNHTHVQVMKSPPNSRNLNANKNRTSSDNTGAYLASSHTTSSSSDYCSGSSSDSSGGDGGGCGGGGD